METLTAESARDLRVHDRISDAVGQTPLVRLGPSLLSGAGPAPHEVWAKIEFMNPMGSVKDRIARHLVRRALATGELRPGGTIVEASSGNTAMGLAMMAVEHGLSCKMVVRRETSPAKLDALRAMGVELILVDGSLPPEHPDSYNRRARQVAAETPGAWFPDQHHNRANNEAHYATTGPEIWRQMEGRIDVFVAGVGTGGTISGVARYLKERDPVIRVVGVDIEGSVFTAHFHGRPLPRPRSCLLEGLGDEEVIGCPEFDLLDAMVQATDREAFLAARRLARREGIFAGGSSGAALWGVEEELRRLGEAGLGNRPARIVTLLPDSGYRYLASIFNDEWMRARGFPTEA